MAKSTKIIAALGVAGMLGMIAMPTFAADTTGITDNIQVQLEEVCTFSASNYATGSGDWGTMTGTAGTDASLSNTWTGTITNSAAISTPKHTMTVKCNHSTGWNITAQNSDKLYTTYVGIGDAGNGGDDIAYDVEAAADHEGWYATISLDTPDTAALKTANFDATNTSRMKDLSSAASIIVSQDSATSTATFGAVYTIATDDTTEAGTYKGAVVYTLAANN